MIYTCANAYYFSRISSIGGIESHLYYISKKYGKYDITVFYRTGDQKQILRLQKNVRCVKLQAADRVVCDKLFCCFNRDILDQVQAKEKYLVLHGDYKDMLNRGQLTRNNLPIDDRINKYLGVSKVVCDSWKEVTGLDAECIYQPVVLEDVDEPLIFCSATRLTKEKGWNRMVKLANCLDEYEVNYIWYVFTNSDNTEPTPNMIICKPRLDISNKIGAFDAYIQLSDNEGYCLSVVESLLRGTPVICTDLPVFKELGLNDSNSIRLDMELSDIPVNRIKRIKDLKFSYQPPEEKWNTVLEPTESRYKGMIMYKVRALGTYKRNRIIDSNLGYIPQEGEVFFMNKERLDVCLGNNPYHIPFVEVLEEIKP